MLDKRYTGQKASINQDQVGKLGRATISQPNLNLYAHAPYLKPSGKCLCCEKDSSSIQKVPGSSPSVQLKDQVASGKIHLREPLPVRADNIDLDRPLVWLSWLRQFAFMWNMPSAAEEQGSDLSCTKVWQDRGETAHRPFQMACLRLKKKCRLARWCTSECMEAAFFFLSP